MRAKCISEAVRDPGAVVRRAAPSADQGADPVDPEAEVELRGVADRAVHLQRHPRGEVRRVTAATFAAETARGVPDSAAPRTSGSGEVQRDPHVRQLVLDRLVGADRAAVLLALLHVLHRVGQQPFATTEQLRGCGEGGPVESRVVEGALAVDREESPSGVDRPDRLAGRTVQESRHVRIQGVRRQRLDRDRDHLALDLRHERRRLDPRPDRELVAEHLEGHDEVDQGAAEATVVLGRHQGRHTLVGQPLPQRQPGLGVAGGPGTCGRDGVGPGHQLGQRLREAGLLGGEPEVHQAPFGSRGSPRMRSAMTLCCTSLVPA